MSKFGGWEILLIVLAILLLFGGRKIPELMKGLGEDNQESTPTKNN
jgi:sec-independent protein translocase protein TatA